VCSSTFKPFESGNLYNVPLEMDLRKIAIKKEEPLKRELKDFLGAIDSKKEPLVTGDSALKTLKIAEAALKSMSSGRKVDIE
jgi:UDP-N-acetylglucosamine 3-dehydrogenase